MSKKLKYLLSIVVVLTTIATSTLLIIPTWYEDEIIKLIKEESNKNLKAELDFKNIDLSLISTFPSLKLELNQLTLTGKDTFRDIKLIELDQLVVNLDLWKIITDGNYEINSIFLNKPSLHIKVLKDGKANYDIYNSSDSSTENTDYAVESSTAFKLKIKNYEVKNGTVIYNDALYATDLTLISFNHLGSITIMDDKFFLETISEVANLDLSYERINYINDSRLKLIFNGEVAFIDEDIKVTITKSLADLNQFQLKTVGKLQMLRDDYLMDLSIATTNQNFKSLFSIVPGAYTKEFDKINTDGVFKFKTTLKGIYNDTVIPAIDMKLEVDDAYFKYPELNSPVENINVGLQMEFPGGDNFDLLDFRLEKLNLNFLNSSISSNAFATNFSSDLEIKSFLEAKFNLSDIAKVIPLEGQDISGLISSEITLDGTLSSIENENFEEFNASGLLDITDLNYQSSKLDYPILLNKLNFEFSPEKLLLNKCNLMIGKSDFKMNGELKNYISYALKDDTISGTFNLMSNLVNIDQLYVDTTSETTNEAEQEVLIDGDSLSELFEIPDNINFSFKSSILKLIYDSLEIKDVKGELLVIDKKLWFNNIGMNFLSGSLKIDGSYLGISTTRANLIMNMHLSNISFDESFLYFNNVKKYTPVVQYLDGNFSSILNMNLLLDQDYNPIYNQLTVDGKLSSKNVKILNHPAFKKMKKLNFEIIEKNNNIEDLNISFKIKNGAFLLDTTNIKLKDLNGEIYGSTSLSQEINYTIESEIPVALVNNNLITGINNILSTPSIEDQKIPLSINVNGTLLQPNYEVSLNLNQKNAKEKIIDAVKDQVLNLKSELLEKAQDKANQILKEAAKKADLIKKESEALAAKVINEANNKNTAAKSNIKREISKVKKEAYQQADKLVLKAKSPLNKLAAKKTAEEIKKKADKEAEKLRLNLTKQSDDALKIAVKKSENIKLEGNKKAELILAKANVEATKLIEEAKNK